jgi:NADH-quinone oxidoreductase subunit E
MLRVEDTQVPQMSVTFCRLIAQFADIVSSYPEGKQKSALLPILHGTGRVWLVKFGPAMDKVAAYLNILPIEVYEVATFYTMYFMRPQGKYVLEVCRTGPCEIVGAGKIMDYIEKNWVLKKAKLPPTAYLAGEV